MYGIKKHTITNYKSTNNILYNYFPDSDLKKKHNINRDTEKNERIRFISYLLLLT